MVSLQELLAKIQAKAGKLPGEEEIDAYLQEFVLRKMPASETLQEAFDVSNVDMEILYAQGYLYYDQNAFEDSTIIFQWLAILNPFTAKYWMGLGNSSLMLKDYEKALKCYAMGTVVDSDNPLPHYYAALCYQALKDPKEKQKAIDLALAKAEDFKYAALVRKIQILRECSC